MSCTLFHPISTLVFIQAGSSDRSVGARLKFPRQHINEIGVLIGILALLLSWWTVATDRNKRLDVHVVSTAEIVRASQDVSDIRVSIGGIEVRDPVVSVLEIRNSGSQPISGSDFERELEISVSEPALIVQASIIETTPSSLKPALRVEGRSAVLDRLLLNPGDSIRIRTITAAGYPQFSVSARVSGVRDVTIDDHESHRQISSVSGSEAVFIAMSSMILWFVLGFLSFGSPSIGASGTRAKAAVVLVANLCMIPAIWLGMIIIRHGDEVLPDDFPLVGPRLFILCVYVAAYFIGARASSFIAPSAKVATGRV